jgi:hypothetical protein
MISDMERSDTVGKKSNMVESHPILSPVRGPEGKEMRGGDK